MNGNGATLGPPPAASPDTEDDTYTIELTLNLAQLRAVFELVTQFAEPAAPAA